MGRISARFAALKQQRRGALIPFLEAWDPDQATSMAILRGMPEAGADLIEIGMPFTDPMADGPIISGRRQARPEGRRQSASRPDHGARLPPRGLRHTVILMGYLNPILSHGAEKILHRCGGGRRGRLDHRRSAARGIGHAAALRESERPGLHSPRRADHG